MGNKSYNKTWKIYYNILVQHGQKADMIEFVHSLNEPKNEGTICILISWCNMGSFMFLTYCDKQYVCIFECRFFFVHQAQITFNALLHYGYWPLQLCLVSYKKIIKAMNNPPTHGSTWLCNTQEILHQTGSTLTHNP